MTELADANFDITNDFLKFLHFIFHFGMICDSKKVVIYLPFVKMYVKACLYMCLWFLKLKAHLILSYLKISKSNLYVFARSYIVFCSMIKKQKNYPLLANKP